VHHVGDSGLSDMTTSELVVSSAGVPLQHPDAVVAG
jgi:hypothetical protein